MDKGIGPTTWSASIRHHCDVIAAPCARWAISMLYIVVNVYQLYLCACVCNAWQWVALFGFSTHEYSNIYDLKLLATTTAIYSSFARSVSMEAFNFSNILETLNVSVTGSGNRSSSSWCIYFNRLKSSPETYRYILTTFIIQDKKITNTQEKSIDDKILHNPSYKTFTYSKKIQFPWFNYPSLDSSISINTSPAVHPPI